MTPASHAESGSEDAHFFTPLSCESWSFKTIDEELEKIGKWRKIWEQIVLSCLVISQIHGDPRTNPISTTSNYIDIASRSSFLYFFLGRFFFFFLSVRWSLLWPGYTATIAKCVATMYSCHTIDPCNSKQCLMKNALHCLCPKPIPQEAYESLAVSPKW